MIVDTLRLLPTDTELTIRVFTDEQVVEVYFMDGRTVMTMVIPPNPASGAVALALVTPPGVRAAGTTAAATVWGMGSVYAAAGGA